MQLRDQEFTTEEVVIINERLQGKLLTTKPVVYLANCSDAPLCVGELETADTTHTTTLQRLGATDGTMGGRIDALETTGGNDSTTAGVSDDSSLVNGAISGAIALCFMSGFALSPLLAAKIWEWGGYDLVLKIICITVFVGLLSYLLALWRTRPSATPV